eukprot:TRINITY_DN16063_c0_g1_i1.p1 TRINITY_DN16063_c0_g1~~TRINITY_DN16063_c0_g1_i1.p1  ORF type:complete len:572 (-),score=33.42 TRINITY_DN16063_c0_g1_i1:103-1818(-)
MAFVQRRNVLKRPPGVCQRDGPKCQVIPNSKDSDEVQSDRSCWSKEDQSLVLPQPYRPRSSSPSTSSTMPHWIQDKLSPRNQQAIVREGMEHAHRSQRCASPRCSNLDASCISTAPLENSMTAKRDAWRSFNLFKTGGDVDFLPQRGVGVYSPRRNEHVEPAHVIQARSHSAAPCDMRSGSRGSRSVAAVDSTNGPVPLSVRCCSVDDDEGPDLFHSGSSKRNSTRHSGEVEIGSSKRPVSQHSSVVLGLSHNTLVRVYDGDLDCGHVSTASLPSSPIARSQLTSPRRVQKVASTHCKAFQLDRAVAKDCHRLQSSDVGAELVARSHRCGTDQSSAHSSFIREAAKINRTAITRTYSHQPASTRSCSTESRSDMQSNPRRWSSMEEHVRRGVASSRSFSPPLRPSHALGVPLTGRTRTEGNGADKSSSQSQDPWTDAAIDTAAAASKDSPNADRHRRVSAQNEYDDVSFGMLQTYKSGQATLVSNENAADGVTSSLQADSSIETPSGPHTRRTSYFSDPWGPRRNIRAPSLVWQAPGFRTAVRAQRRLLANINKGKDTGTRPSVPIRSKYR